MFLSNEIENEPRWLRYNNQDGWSRHGHDLAVWRRQAKDLGDTEARLLKLVLAELRHDLETRESRSRAMYHRSGDKRNDEKNGFWKEKIADFAKTAEIVLAERSKSGAAVQYIAEYFYWGLDYPKRAIEVLFAANKQKLLTEEGQGRLIEFLHLQKRFEESIAVLTPLVERRPTNLEYRVQLMRAYFRTGRESGTARLAQADRRVFPRDGPLGESPLERLANITLETELFEKSVAYYKELIPLHERTHANRGIGTGTLANYYIGLANAYAGLEENARSRGCRRGAVVAWGARGSGTAARPWRRSKTSS